MNDKHAYVPDAMAMGDCRVCGHVAEATHHSEVQPITTPCWCGSGWPMKHSVFEVPHDSKSPQISDIKVCNACHDFVHYGLLRVRAEISQK